MTDDSAEILFQSFLQEALVSSSGIGRDVHSFTLSIWHSLCWPLCRPPFKVPWRMVLELGCCGTWHAWTIRVFISWQLLEEVHVDPQGSWSCQSPSCWSCDPSWRCREVPMDKVEEWMSLPMPELLMMAIGTKDFKRVSTKLFLRNWADRHTKAGRHNRQAVDSH